MTEIKADVNFVEMAEDVAIIKKVLLGNGVKGLCERFDTLCERVDEIEIAVKEEKPRYSLKDYIAGLGVLALSLIAILVKLFKGE